MIKSRIRLQTNFCPFPSSLYHFPSSIFHPLSGEDRLILHAHPALYFLEVELPYNVIPMECGAQFDVDSHLLTIALMVTEETTQ